MLKCPNERCCGGPPDEKLSGYTKQLVAHVFPRDLPCLHGVSARRNVSAADTNPNGDSMRSTRIRSPYIKVVLGSIVMQQGIPAHRPQSRAGAKGNLQKRRANGKMHSYSQQPWICPCLTNAEVWILCSYIHKLAEWWWKNVRDVNSSGKLRGPRKSKPGEGFCPRK